jgi:hypothetical protein
MRGGLDLGWLGPCGSIRVGSGDGSLGLSH